MNDFVLYGIAFLMGVVVHRLWFGGTRPGPFEQSLMYNLTQGKKVTVAIDDECYIFELNGDRMRITRGVATHMEEEYDPSIMADSITDQSNNDDSTRI